MDSSFNRIKHDTTIHQCDQRMRWPRNGARLRQHWRDSSFWLQECLHLQRAPTPCRLPSQPRHQCLLLRWSDRKLHSTSHKSTLGNSLSLRLGHHLHVLLQATQAAQLRHVVALSLVVLFVALTHCVFSGNRTCVPAGTLSTGLNLRTCFTGLCWTCFLIVRYTYSRTPQQHAEIAWNAHISKTKSSNSSTDRVWGMSTRVPSIGLTPLTSKLQQKLIEKRK